MEEGKALGSSRGVLLGTGCSHPFLLCGGKLGTQLGMRKRAEGKAVDEFLSFSLMVGLNLEVFFSIKKNILNFLRLHYCHN